MILTCEEMAAKSNEWCNFWALSLNPHKRSLDFTDTKWYSSVAAYPRASTYEIVK